MRHLFAGHTALTRFFRRPPQLRFYQRNTAHIPNDGWLETLEKAPSVTRNTDEPDLPEGVLHGNVSSGQGLGSQLDLPTLNVRLAVPSRTRYKSLLTSDHRRHVFTAQVWAVQVSFDLHIWGDAVAACQLILPSFPEFEIHVYDPKEMSIPNREASWGVPIYIRPLQYLRNRCAWKSDEEADNFFQSGGRYAAGGHNDRVTIEMKYDAQLSAAVVAQNDQDPKRALPEVHR